MPFPFYGQDGYLRSTVVNVFDKFCLKLVSRQFIQIKNIVPYSAFPFAHR